MKTTGTIIRELREKTGLTMDEMADRLKTYNVNPSKSMISRWENDKAEPSMEYARILARFFDVSLDYLLGLDTDKEQEKTEQLSSKAERDIQRSLSETLDVLENSQDALMFDGEPLDDETRELLKSSLENSMRLAKKIAKEKYTPKKYKK